MPETSFQRTLRLANAAQAARAILPGWRDAYANEVYSPGVVHRPTEDRVFDSLYEAQRRRKGVYTLLEMGIPLLREVLQELRTKRREQMPLKALLAKQGKTLEWVDMGGRRNEGRRVVSVVVPIGAGD